MADSEEHEEDSGAKPRTLPDEINLFAREIDSLVAILPDLTFAITMAERRARQRFIAYAEKFGAERSKTEKTTTYSFPPPYDVRAASLNDRAHRTSMAGDLLPRLLVLALVAQFDAFVGKLLRAIFLLRPELFETSERSLTFAQLTELGTLEAARDYLLEKEIESILRRSHADQFAWMEKRFEVPLRKGLSSWKTFIELTERRNLFAHTSGVVSDQYIAICRSQNVELSPGCVKGAVMSADADYIKAAHRCIFEIGIKLSQVLWRKVVPTQINQADDNLIAVTFDLIISGSFGLAKELLDFSCDTLKRVGSEHSRRILTINRAQVYKWSDEAEKCSRILAAEDWSACGPEFQLAVAVLSNDFGKAGSLMRSMGKSGPVNVSAYQEWPLFQEFRKSREFTDAYLEVFGEPFVHIETTLKNHDRERGKAAIGHLRKLLEEDGGLDRLIGDHEPPAT